MNTKKEQKTFRALYGERMKQPTPAAAFVTEVARVTHKSRETVYNWISGRYTPDALTTETLARHLGVAPEGLFPKG